MLEKSNNPIELQDKLAATGMKGKNIVFVEDWSYDQIMALFEASALLEPYFKLGTKLLDGKILYNLFFQPSTRTRSSHATAMYRMGGSVITDTDPMLKSAMAKGESLADVIRVISEYADVLVLRHPDDKLVFEAIKQLDGHSCPIISGGWGHITHPTQGFLDLYTAWRFLGKPFKEMTIMISTPDLSRARAAHSFAICAAMMGAKVVYTGAKGLGTPKAITDKLDSFGADYEEHFDLTREQNVALMEEVADLIYTPGCVQNLNDPNRGDFMANAKKHYLCLADFEGIKKRTGKVIGLMHPLSRQAFEMEQTIDNTEYQLYFHTIGFSVPVRMALFAAILGTN